MPVVAYKKRKIPNAVRREVARRHGGVPGQTVRAECAYCGAPGEIYWPVWTGFNGRVCDWVTFPGLELDHIRAEVLGGESTADNITLACRPCNREKGHGF